MVNHAYDYDYDYYNTHKADRSPTGNGVRLTGNGVIPGSSTSGEGGDGQGGGGQGDEQGGGGGLSEGGGKGMEHRECGYESRNQRLWEEISNYFGDSSDSDSDSDSRYDSSSSDSSSDSDSRYDSSSSSSSRRALSSDSLPSTACSVGFGVNISSSLDMPIDETAWAKIAALVQVSTSSVLAQY